MHAGIFLDFNPSAEEHLRSGYVAIYGYPYQVYADVLGMNNMGQIVGSYFDADPGRTLG